MNFLNLILLASNTPGIHFEEVPGLFILSIIPSLSLIFTLAFFGYIIYTLVKLNKFIKKADKGLDIYLKEHGNIDG